MSKQYIETPHGVYVAQDSHDGSGIVVWTADYERLVGFWPSPLTMLDVRVDINAGRSGHMLREE